MFSRNKEPLLDDTDRQILNVLLQDANTTYADIAKQIHVSAGTVHVRMRRLNALNIAQPAFLNLNYRKISYDIISFFAIFADRADAYPNIAKQLQPISEVVAAHLTTGAFGLLIQVICRDTRHLHRTMQQLQQLPNVQRLDSFLSLDQPIHRPLYLKDDYYFDQHDEA